MSSTDNNDDKTSNYGSGYLEISEKGFGFLRTAANHFHPKPTDIFVTPDTIRRSFLREGSHVAGATQPPHRGTSPQLKAVEKVNDMPFEEYTKAVRFENLTTIDPIEKFNLETTPELIETRIIDLVTPIGKGTRGLIVSPPRSGKTTILKQICNAITTNHPDVHTMVLLIDERPEDGGLAAARRGDNQPARALANRRDEVNDARFEQFGSGFEVELFNRVNGGEVFKADGLGVFLERHVVDFFDGLELRTGAAMWRLRRSGDMAALAQKVAADGVGRDKNVGRLGMKMVGRGAQEAETLLGYFQVAGTVIGRFIVVVFCTAHILCARRQEFIPKPILNC